MVLPTSKKNVGLGKAMIRSRFRGGTRPKDHDTDLVHTTDMDDGPSWTKLQSITQEGDLDSFLRIAELADTDFTAHRQNVTVVSAEDNNPFLMSKDEETRVQKLHKTFQNEVVIPRRPHWEKTMSAREVQRNEQASFLDWRRSLALLQEANGLLLTPYERNLEVWRQLWRVVERSQLVVQIVDARNPMTFRSEDLEKYVSEVHGGSVDCLLLVNKADLLTDSQRAQWADYFDKNNIKYKFFSAKISNVELERELEREMVILSFLIYLFELTLKSRLN
jgi:large subunit GTPase 1